MLLPEERMAALASQVFSDRPFRATASAVHFTAPRNANEAPKFVGFGHTVRSVSTYLAVHVHACMHNYIHAYLPTYMPTWCVRACM